MQSQPSERATKSCQLSALSLLLGVFTFRISIQAPHCNYYLSTEVRIKYWNFTGTTYLLYSIFNSHLLNSDNVYTLSTALDTPTLSSPYSKSLISDSTT